MTIPKIRDGVQPLPTASEPQPENPALLTIAQSNISGTALNRSRARWLAPPPTYGSAPFPTLLTRFSSTSKGRNVAVVRQAAHRINELGSCDVVIGPHTFPNTRFFRVHWEAKPPPQPKPPPVARPLPQPKPAPKPAMKPIPKPGLMKPMPYQLAKPPLKYPAGPAGSQAAGQRPTPAAGPSQPPTAAQAAARANVSPALVNALNAAARQDPVLASHLAQASQKTASPETLQALGRYIKAVQAELARDEARKAGAAKPASASPNPQPAPRLAPPPAATQSKGTSPVPGPARQGVSPVPTAAPTFRPAQPQPAPSVPSVAAASTNVQAPSRPPQPAPAPNHTPTSAPQTAPASSIPSNQPPPATSNADKPTETPSSDVMRLKGGAPGSPTQQSTQIPPSQPAPAPRPLAPAATIVPKPVVAAPVPAPTPAPPSSAPTAPPPFVSAGPPSPEGGRIRKPTLKKLEAEEGEKAYSAASHRPASFSFPQPRAPAAPSTSSSGGYWNGPGRTAVVMEFEELPTERWLVPAWAMVEKEEGDMVISFFGPPDRVGELPMAAYRPPAPKPAPTIDAPPADVVPGAATATEAPLTTPPIAGSSSGATAPTIPQDVAGPASAPSSADPSSASATTSSAPAASAPAPAPPVPSRPKTPPPRGPTGPLQPAVLRLLSPSGAIVEALEHTQSELGWSAEAKEEWFARQWREGGCARERELLQWQLPRNVSGPLAELVQGVELVGTKGAKGKRKDGPVGADLFAIPAKGAKKKKPPAVSRAKRASIDPRGRKSTGTPVADLEGSATPAPSASTPGPSAAATPQAPGSAPATDPPRAEEAVVPMEVD